MLSFKEPNESFSDLTEQMQIAVFILADVVDWLEPGDIVITSTTGGQHVPGSKHYAGRAIDVRTRNWIEPQAVAEAVATVLGPDFDVILESDHLHIEFDPNRNRRH